MTQKDDEQADGDDLAPDEQAKVDAVWGLSAEALTLMQARGMALGMHPADVTAALAIALGRWSALYGGSWEAEHSPIRTLFEVARDDEIAAREGTGNA